MLEIKELIWIFKDGLTLDGRKRVLEDEKELSSDDLKLKSDPEAYTKELLIEPIIRKLKLEQIPEVHFRGIKNELRKADYYLKNKVKDLFLLEAKPINADLFKISSDGAVNQIKGLFRLAEVKEKYEFGIATDGLRWVFIDHNSIIVYDFNILTHSKKIENILSGKEEVSADKVEEEISRRFYDWYNALLNGGEYKDENNKKRNISTKDCLINNIVSVSDESDREQIAQSILNRLIFIKFLSSKEIIAFDVLDYLGSQNEDILNEKFKQLSFQVLNTEKNKRYNIDSRFKDIPYLNGSLFTRTKVEIENPDYKIKAFILREAIKFLDSFKFTHSEDISKDQIDPEILGYIFERAMTSKDRKGTGSYYTRKTITKFISEQALYPLITNKTNIILKERGYKNSELIEDFNDIYKLRAPTLEIIYNEVILKLKICDNACGSGSFLLSVCNLLLSIYKRINAELRLRTNEIAIRKLILKENIYGVDFNTNAIEIAKLRLWLWLVSIYNPENVEALPNIEYNLREGNSLFGFIDISKYKSQRITFADYFSDEELLLPLLKTRDKLISFYNSASGEKAKNLKTTIEKMHSKISNILNIRFYEELIKRGIKLKKERFLEIKPFHWGYEFYSIFNKDSNNKSIGFDVIVGNPPYGNLLSQVEKNIVKEYYTCLKAKNIAENFFERSFDLLKENHGVLGYVTPKTIAFYGAWEEIRQLIMEYKIACIYDVGLGFVGVNFEEIVLLIEKRKISNYDSLIYVAKNLKSSTKDKSPIFNGSISIQKMKKHNTIIFRFLTEKEFDIISHIENNCRRFNEIYKSAFRGLYIPDKEKETLKAGNTKWINKVPDVKRFYISKVFNIHLSEEKWVNKAKIIMKPRLFFKVLRGKRLVCYPDFTGEYLTTEKLVNVVFESDQENKLGALSLIINSYVPSFYIQKMLFSETTETSRVMDDMYVGEIPIPELNEYLQPLTILCQYMLFLNSSESNRENEKEIIEFIDNNIIDSLVFELYFKQVLKTNLVNLLNPLLSEFNDLKSSELNLTYLKKMVSNIKNDREILKEISKINDHEWVSVLKMDN